MAEMLCFPDGSFEDTVFQSDNPLFAVENIRSGINVEQGK